jgi:hypothetical protein
MITLIFFASQLRIRIEMAFGLMVKKWGILLRPLHIKLSNIKHLVMAIGKLHNFCINERLATSKDVAVFTPTNVSFNRHDEMLRDDSSFFQFEEMQLGYENPWSYNRDRMVKEVAALHLTRPGVRKN